MNKWISEIKFSKLSIISLAFFPLLPFFSVLAFATILFIDQKTKPNNFYIFFFLLSLYLGLINATKIPDNDLKNYYGVFSQVKFYSFLEYTTIFGKEPVFFALSYILYYVTNGSTQWYIIILSVISYWFFFIAIYKFFFKVNNQTDIIVFAVILAAFLPQLFALSAHLLRQFLASSIVMYVLVSKIFYGKTKWFYLLIVGFIHSSVLLLIPFIFINRLKNRFSLKAIILVIALIFLVIVNLQKITTFILGQFGVTFLTYAISRTTGVINIGVESLPVLSYILIGLMFVISIFRVYRKSTLNDEMLKSSLIHFVNISFILFFFILANISQKLISIRFFFFIYFFFPFIIPLVLKRTNYISYFTQISFSMFFIVFFIYRLEYGIWQYAPLSELLFNPIYSLF